MLLKEFYNILESETLGKDAAYFKVELNPRHEIYMGHFPGNAVTPGVGLLQIVKELLEFQLKIDLRLQDITMLKFLTLVDPNENSELNFKLYYVQKDKLIKANTETTLNNGNIVLKCNATFVETNLISNSN